MRNLALLTDFYQLTMMNGYLKHGIHNNVVVFDYFFRKNPCNSSYTIVAGIEQLIDYLENLEFSQGDLSYLRDLGFGEDFLNALRNFKFTGTMYGVPEGSIMFPNEPVIRVKGPCFEAQLIETALLNIMNFQSLIATKASRICQAAKGDDVFEFGLRRAQGPDAGVYGARSAYIGGCSSTSNVLAGKKFDIPVVGTQAHSWIQSFDDELQAFQAYADVYPDNCLLLVDTYDVLESGVPNAIKVFEDLRDRGYKAKGIRIDSGDIAFLSKKARKLLDDAGFTEASIVASSDLDEDVINSLKMQEAAIDGWGVGTNLITSSKCPALGGVYKLSAIEEEGEIVARIKISENPSKITNPGYKKVVRIYDRQGQMAQADLIMLEGEEINIEEPLTIFDPIYTWKRKTFSQYSLREMLIPIYEDGKLVYPRKTAAEVKAYAATELDTLWPEYKRFTRPHLYKVDLSQDLWDLKHDMVKGYK